MFGCFGVTPRTVLEEERRLFYVAMTRAKRRLFLLTDEDEESPYLEVIKPKSTMSSIPTQPRSREGRPLGKLAGKLREKIGGLGDTAGEPRR
ncbi:MAG: 3'-5' exonuclease [Gammaproteobacteria bacterium]